MREMNDETQWLSGSRTKRGADYRDELNFAEFPLASLSDKPPRGVKTLVFSDQIFDQGKRQLVPRKLTVSASDEHGLPTPLDEEVLLGLIQLSHGHEFQTSTLHFSRYQLIKLLGWADGAKSYRRIEESLKRWVGVTLYYDRAWWSREEQCWVSESFHVINQVTLFDRERRERRLEADPENPNAGLSSIVWSEPVFKSFRAGNLKPLDLELYTSFRTAIAKRVFRFLDKRFHFRSKLEFGLREFACEHIGMSKDCPNAEIRRRLKPGLEELEKAGFLAEAPETERFTREAWGQWKVHFKRATIQQKLTKPHGSFPELVQELISRGISRHTARRLAAAFPEEFIREKVRFVDSLRSRKDGPPIRNSAGFLVKAIQEDYSAAPSSAVRASSSAGPRGLSPASSELPTPPADDSATQAWNSLDAFLETLSASELRAFEEAAVAATDSSLLKRQYLDGKDAGGSLFEAVRNQILLDHLKRQPGDRRAA